MASSSFTKPALSVPTASTIPSTDAPAPPSSSLAPVEDVAGTPDSVSARLRSADQVPGPEEPEPDEDHIRRIARETVAEDLRAWQDKYYKAADEAAAEIETKVGEISKRMIRRQAHVMGRSLVEQLQQTVVSELVQLRRDLKNIAGAVQKGSASRQDGEEQIAIVVRRAGMEIKQRAQDVRTWHKQYARGAAWRHHRRCRLLLRDSRLYPRPGPAKDRHEVGLDGRRHIQGLGQVP